MKKDKIEETLQMEIAVPALVQQRADAVFEQIQRENSGKGEKMIRKSMWGTVAAAMLALSTVTVCAAAYMNWSSGMEEQFDATEEQKIFLEEQEMVKPLHNSVTKEGITVTAQQSIADSRFAHLSFRVEGYEVKEDGILQPDFEAVHVTVDGKEGFVLKHAFFNNWHITEKERTYTNDDTPIRERVDGTLVERYRNDDGSMEYIITVMKNIEESSLIGKKVHVELVNLGAHVRYSSAYRKEVEAVWSFDFTLEGSDQVRSEVMSQPLGDSGATVTKVELSPISFYVEYEYNLPTLEMKGNHAVWTLGSVPPLVGVRLKDGTQITGAMGGASEGKAQNVGRYVYY
ncbi:MAG: DUF4179 domain-containing protein, partial [Lachnospiraceae bacterium]|nr:DUF4179 domain-containing protein [Lachnospiraceae bacterium]